MAKLHDKFIDDLKYRMTTSASSSPSSILSITPVWSIVINRIIILLLPRWIPPVSFILYSSPRGVIHRPQIIFNIVNSLLSRSPLRYFQLAGAPSKGQYRVYVIAKQDGSTVLGGNSERTEENKRQYRVPEIYCVQRGASRACVRNWRLWWSQALPAHYYYFLTLG